MHLGHPAHPDEARVAGEEISWEAGYVRVWGGRCGIEGCGGVECEGFA